MSDANKKVVDAVSQWRPNFVLDNLPESDKDVYRKLHAHHCDKKGEANHTCQGTVSLRADSISLRCALCGNTKVSL